MGNRVHVFPRTAVFTGVTTAEAVIPALSGIQRIQVVGCILTMDAAGSLLIQDDTAEGTDGVTFALGLGIPLVFEASRVNQLYTGGANKAIEITATGGAASGVLFYYALSS